jgi:glycosyltransferase involved in cell wall biosynthesis
MIFARRQAECLAAEGVEAPIFYLGSRTSPARLLGEMVRFRSSIARHRPDVIHAHFGTMTAMFSALGCGMLPLVITYRGSDLNPPPASYSWKAKLRATWGRLFSQLASLRARRIVCVSRRLSNHLWWRRGVVAILPSGVDADFFRPEPRLHARQSLGWSDAERVALFHAGRDSQVKRLDLAQAAVGQARRKVPSLRLEVLDGNVSPATVPLLMNAADCLLLTSVSEGSPSVVQEALASNLPIVSVAVGDVEERLAGVQHSIVATPDAAVLGRALARLVDPPRRSDGRKKLPQFCARRLARQLKDIYGEMLKERA